MTTFKNVAGNGYGSGLVDSLISGGRVWDMSKGSINYMYGLMPTRLANGGEGLDWQGAERNRDLALKDPHPTSDYLSHRWLTSTWWKDDRDTMKYVLDLYESVSNLKFQEMDIRDTGTFKDANLVWWLTKLADGNNNNVFSAIETPNAYPQFGNQRWGYFDNVADLTHDVYFAREFGGYGLEVMIRTVGAGLGLTRPSDTAQEGGSAFAGAADGSLGTYGQNQSVYTVMSNNMGYNAPNETDKHITFGAQGGLGALDIAAIQALYGVNTTTATGNDTYYLPNTNGGAGWYGIWDAGGVDTISGEASITSVTIDLRSATLIENDPHAGGYLSRQDDIQGGYTIAKGALVENAIGGSGNDILVGNDAANVLDGRTGNDTYHIGAGDTVIDTGGIDTVYSTVAYDNPNIENIFINGVATKSNGNPVVKGQQIIKGTKAKDNLVGSAGSDKIDGGFGNDKLTGLGGKDVFQFTTKPSKNNKDMITDFKGDKIALSKSVFKGLQWKKGVLKADNFWAGKTAQDSKDHILFDGKTVYYDPDGDDDKGAVAIFNFQKKLSLKALKASDFISA